MAQKNRWRHLIHAAVVCMGFGSMASGQQSDADDASVPIAKLQAMQNAVGQLTMKRNVGEQQLLELHPKPLFRWNSPLSRVTDGAVFLWSFEGRPEVFGNVFLIKDGPAVLEVQSLSSGPLATTLNGRLIWAPEKPGLEWNSIPHAPVPAATKAEQFRQIRNLATEFGAYAKKSPPDYEEGSTWHFRLMAKAFFEYGDTATNRGAVFAFAQGTDPEAFLLIECRQNQDGVHKWHYAFAGACVWELYGEHLERQVWKRPKSPCLLNSTYSVVRPFPVSLDPTPPSK